MPAKLNYSRSRVRRAEPAGLLGPDIPGWNFAAAALASGTTYLYKVSPDRDYTITNAWLAVTTASGTDDALEIAVYNDDLTARLATSGSVTGKLNATGVQSVAIEAALKAGTRYTVAFKAASTASVRFAAWTTATLASAFGTSASALMLAFINGLSTPLPTSIGTPSAASQVPLLALREV